MEPPADKPSPNGILIPRDGKHAIILVKIDLAAVAAWFGIGLLGLAATVTAVIEHARMISILEARG